MRYYLDFEFEDELMLPLSLGIVSQDGRELYLVRPDWLGVVTQSKNFEWLSKNVTPDFAQMPEHEQIFTSAWPQLIKQFIGDDSAPEFWGYFCDYDWVLFCHLFGRMIDLPEQFPKFCLDLKQLAMSFGITQSLKKIVPMKNEHNALADARWMRTVHNMIIVQYGRSV